MTRLSPYSIGAPPNFDPCDKCLIKVTCSEKCDPKWKYELHKPKKEKIIIKLRRKKRKIRK